MPKKKKRINDEQLMKLEKTEGKNERDCKWGKREKVREERGWIQLLLQV